MRIRKSTISARVVSTCVASVMVSAFLAVMVIGPVSGAELVVHVSPTGDDAAGGSRAKPVGSLIGARDVVRRVRAAGDARPVRVVVADGTCRVAAPLILTPEDGGSAAAPVRYEAAPGAKPVFSGGRKISGFQPGANGLWVADVPGVASGQWNFEQLWVDGRRAQRALAPKTNWERISKWSGYPGGRNRNRNPDIDPFSFQSEAAVMLDGTRNILFHHCEIAQVGTHGLWFRKGCSHIRVERSLIRDLGGSGMRVGEVLEKRGNIAPIDHVKAGVYGHPAWIALAKATFHSISCQ